MLVQPGGIYRLRLSIYNAPGIGPAWLVGALGVTYPRAEIAAIEAYSEQSASVLVRWRRAPQQLERGATIRPLLEGMDVPGARMPMAVVDDIEVVSEPAAAPAVYYTALKLVGAAGLIGLTALLSARISKKHGNAPAA